MLHEFLTQHRDELIERARRKVASRPVPRATPEAIADGVPVFLSQLTELLRERAMPASAPTSGERTHDVVGGAADQQGDAQQRAGLTVAQVVEGYGDVCQAVTELATDLGKTIGADEYRTLNLCVDVATARAVTAYSGSRDRQVSDREVERLGRLAHELRNLLSTALLAVQALKVRGAGLEGRTGALLERSLRGLRAVVDRSLAEVRLAAALVNRERVVVADFMEEAEVSAGLDAKARGVALEVPAVDPGLAVDVDRPLLASAVGNLVQNAIKFTRPSGRITLRAFRAGTRVHIEVEDECGGLAEGVAERLFEPFAQHGDDRAGLGLGLKISRDAVNVNGGEIRVRNVPGRGCIFTVDLPAVA